MKIKGITRKIDSLGRVVIPKEFRDTLGLQKFELIEILLTNNGVLIKKISNNCCICGEKDKLIELEDSLVCLNCINKIKGL